MSVYVKRASTAASKIVPDLTFKGYKSLAINSGDFKSSGDTFFVYYHVGPICIVSFYLTAAKAFGTWYDAIVNSSSTIPSPAMAVQESSTMDSIYMEDVGHKVILLHSHLFKLQIWEYLNCEL